MALGPRAIAAIGAAAASVLIALLLLGGGAGDGGAGAPGTATKRESRGPAQADAATPPAASPPVLPAGDGSAPARPAEDGGPPRIRLFDDATDATLPAGIEPVVEYTFPTPAGLPKYFEREPLHAEAGGWWSMRRVSPHAIEFRVRAAGYRDAPLDGWNGTGPRTARLAASGTGVRGVLEAPSGAKEPAAVWVNRMDRPGEGGRLLLGRVRAGPFLLDALDTGDWEIEVKWEISTWVIRRFHYDGGLLDLGPLRVLPDSSLRVRWSASAPVDARTPLVLQRAEVRGGPPVMQFSQANARGEFLFLSLLAGEVYELSSPRVPGWRERVTAPGEPGAEGEFEAGRDLRLARCRLTVTVDGKKPVGRIVFLEAGVPAPVDLGADNFEFRMVPGRQKIRAMTKSTFEGEVMRTYGDILSAEFDLPDVAEYEATVDLKSTRWE